MNEIDLETISKNDLATIIIKKDNLIKKQQEEIERLSKMLEDKFYKEYPFIVENGIICKKNKEIERLHSIIKEVREYMNNLRWFEMFTKEHDITLYASTKDFYRDIKEILDKVEEK